MSNSFGKIVATAALAGALGGGIVYGGISYFNNNGTSLVSTDNSNGTAKVSNTKVNVSTQAETAFKNNKNAVVSVINLQKAQSQDGSLASIFGGGNSSSNSKDSDELETASEGSGVIYKKSGNDAYIVTNNHVVSGSSAIEVILSNGKKVSAKVVGKDSVTDLAVLKMDASQVKQVATFGNSDAIKVAEPVIAIGSPLGSDYATSVTQGIISAKKREVPQTNSNNQQIGNATVIQTDTAINPGNSGGPLVNMAGQVIGINSMKLANDSSGTSVEGMGFAIPSNEVVKIINQLVANGKVVRPALGISVIDLTNVSSTQQSSVLKLPTSVKSGVVVASVNANSVAKKAGISKYDVIVGLGGKDVTSVADLHTTLYSYDMNSTVEIQYYHNGELKKSTVKLTEAASTDSTTAAK